jgi:hypothetical protein
MRTNSIILIALLLAGATESLAARVNNVTRASTEACMRAEFILESLGVTEAQYVSQAKDQNDLEKRLQSMGWVAKPDPFSKTTTYTKATRAATITIDDLLAGQQIPQHDEWDQKDLQYAVSRGTSWSTPTAERKLADARLVRQMPPEVLFKDMSPGHWVQFRKLGESELTVGRFLGVTEHGLIQYMDYSKKTPEAGRTPQTISPDRITRGSVDEFNYSHDARNMQPTAFKQLDQEFDQAMQGAAPGAFITFRRPGSDELEVGKILKPSKSAERGHYLDFYMLGSTPRMTGRAIFDMTENADPHSIQIYQSEDAFRKADPNYGTRLDAYNKKRQDEENEKAQQKAQKKQAQRELSSKLAKDQRAKKQKITNQLEVLSKQQGKYLQGGEKVALADILSIKFQRYFKAQEGKTQRALMELMSEMIPKENRGLKNSDQWPALTMKWVYRQYPELEELKLPEDPSEIDPWIDQLERKIGGQLVVYPYAGNGDQAVQQ